MKKNKNKNRNKQKQQQKKHAPLQGSVRGYIREISVGMFLQIQTDIYIYLSGLGDIYIYIYIYIDSAAFVPICVYIYTQMVTKAAECRLIKFFFLGIGQSNPLFIL